MTSILASAPGKVILSGEYAVLRGAPAISTAVDRRAIVRIVANDNQYHSVSTPGHAEGTWRFTVDRSGQIDWQDEPPPDGLGLIEAGWHAVRPSAETGLSITLDTSEFFASTVAAKLGLGSSAAAMIALVGALDRLEPGMSDVCGLAGRAHKAFQQGLGSGVDIATSFSGGVIEFRSGMQNEPLRRTWPAGLDFRLLWSGTPASTVDKIAGMNVPGTDDERWEPLSISAEAAAAAWTEGDTMQILDAFRRYTDTLRQFSIDQGLGIFDAGHDELADLATSVNLVYKPCGAGGGDIGIVLAGERADDGRELDEFCNKAEAVGFQLLTLLPDPSGFRCTVGEAC